MKKYQLTEGKKQLLVAFSGGCDSVCLLHALHKLSQTESFQLAAVHINHQWREKESKKDEQFASQFCKSLEIPFFAEKLDKGLPKTELIAREHRYKLINNIAIKNNFNALLTAHHLDDCVETILIRIIKGTGLKGLTGIPEYRTQENGPAIYRPLLTCSKETIQQYIQNNNLTYRIDQSNYDEKYLRNKIRHSLLPSLQELNPNINTSLLNLSAISRYSEEAIKTFLADSTKNIFVDTQTINTRSFLALNKPIKPIIIRYLLEQNNIEYDFQLIERLVDHINHCEKSFAGKKFSITKNLFLHITKNNAKIVSPEPANVIQSSATMVIPGITELKELNIRLKVTEYCNDVDQELVFPPANAEKALVDLSHLNTELVLRTRRPGDIINPIGMNGHMKLKKYLINKHIPQHQKDFIPVMASGSEILWLVGIGLSEKIRVTKAPTHILELIRG